MGKLEEALRGDVVTFLLKMMSEIHIREIRKDEIHILDDMLYEAIYQPDEQNLIPRSVLQVPEINAYVKDFGKEKDDYCYVADLKGKIIGAVWGSDSCGRDKRIWKYR